MVAVSRDSGGIFLGASCITVNYISCPETLEAMAIREALALAEDLYVWKIHVASDCKVVVDGVKQGSSAEYGAILHEIIEHPVPFLSCNIVHEFRSSNIEAHTRFWPPCVVGSSG